MPTYNQRLTANNNKIDEITTIARNLPPAGGSSEPNIFVQLEEPTSKDGIWLQTNKTAEHYISDDNIFIGGTWAPDDISKYLPSNFSYNKATVVNNDIYLITIGYKYNPSTNVYTKITSAPYNTWSARTVTVGTDIYIFGGSSSSERRYTYKYDTLTDTYTRMTDFPESYGFRYGGAAVVGTNIYIFGNDYYDASTEAHYNYKYDTLTNTYTKMSNIPYVFSVSPVIALGTDIYLLGGGGTSGSQTRYNYKYDTLTNTYTRMTDIPYNFYWGAATLVGTDIYLLGGQGSTTNNYKYDALTDTYTKMTDIPYSFYAGDVVTVGTDIYLLSGVNSQKTNRTFHLESKQYGLDNSIVIFNGMKYKTELFNSEFEVNYKPKYNFIDAWFYTTNDGLITDIPSYYGDGTQWINFKNPPTTN